MPCPSHTRKRFLKAAAIARAGKSCQNEGSPNNAANLVIKLLTDSEPENENVSKTDCVNDAETFECDWDGSVNTQLEALPQSSSEEGRYESEISSDESEVEVWELEGEELLQSLGQCITKEQDLLSTLTPLERLQNIPASVWTKVGMNQHLGYNGLSK
ncbi:hypothetical protein EDC04DRAFT_2602033 [Pisolithus marmoratus]|nr:hypothetical protein EDC04DRAFT_2602033 [Pisolithus marmoratus]